MSSHEAVLETTLTTAPDHVYEPATIVELPIDRQKDILIDAMVHNQVVIVHAPTGSGKSTRMPQFALEAGFEYIKQVQPRRPAATNVAERIEEELGIQFGEEYAAETVNCQTGGGLIGQYDTRVQVMTEGILRIRDTFQPTSGSGEVWILDEAHENSNEMWMLAGFAKDKLPQNSNFTVVVMTATPNMYETIDYWTNELGVEPAVVELEGGTNYEIEHREEPESTTAREAVKAAIDIHENPDTYDGANTIQVFEAGKREIQDTIDAILAQLPREVAAKARVLANHAKLTPAERKLVYEDFDGIKIVVQTNIGRTSVTMPRTRYVITSGKERMIILDEDDDTPGLMKVDSPQDCMIQQKGRGGRTCPSIFIHTRHKGDEFVPMYERALHLEAEILRSNIDFVVMGLALKGINIRDFDGRPMPTEAAINRSMHRLQMLGAFDENERLTKLGQRMGKYPASPEHQRCLVEAEKYSEQVRLGMAAMVASVEVGGLRLHDPGSAGWEKLTDEKTSDAFSQLEMFIAVQRKRVNSQIAEDLDKNNVLRAEELYRKIARRAGITDIPPLQIPSVQNRKLLHDCIVRGFAHSAYLPQGQGMFKAVGGALKLREISRRSVVPKNTRHAVVGKPRDIEIERDGVSERKPIIESVTEVPINELGKYIGNLTSWHSTGFRLRAGKFVQVRQQVFGNQVLETQEVHAEPSPQLRAAVIEHVRARPGKHLIELYQIKRELEHLARRTKYPIPMLTEDAIHGLIEQAAPAEVSSPGHVDNNLRQLITDRQISVDSFLSPERRAKILADAPDQITIEGYQLQLRYSRGKPIAKRYTIDMLEGLDQDPTLPDGRQIFFIQDNKRYTWQQLRNRLRLSGEL